MDNLRISSQQIKKHFDVFKQNPNLVYLDSGASSLKLDTMADLEAKYYRYNGTNIHRGVYNLSHQATIEYEKTREMVANFIHAFVQEIIFTRGTTNSLNMVATMLSDMINPGDEIIVSELEHHSSLLPWQVIARKKGAILKYVTLDQLGRITVENFQQALSPQTKIVALTYVSNVLGHVTPVKAITKLAHQYNAIVIIDAAQAAPHLAIDVKDLDVDFLAFSAHKMLGPTGLGILYGKYHLLKQLDPVEFGGDMNDYVDLKQATYKDPPYKFEAGTVMIGQIIAFQAALKFINDIGINAIHHHLKNLATYTANQLKTIKNLELCTPNPESGIITFNVKGVHPHDVASFLESENIAIRAGHHCAQLCSNWLVEHKFTTSNGTVRASIYIYNDQDDLDQLISAIKKTCQFFKEWSDE